jgi:hypothetical protein
MTFPCLIWSTLQEDAKARRTAKNAMVCFNEEGLNLNINKEQGSLKEEGNARSKEYWLNHNGYSLFDMKHFTGRREGPRRMQMVCINEERLNLNIE